MKNQLRIKAKELKKSLDIKTLSSQIKENLFLLEEFKNAKNICCYYSVRDEIITTDYFDDTSKNWFIPKVNGEDLLICPYNKNSLEKGIFGLLEPTNEPIEDLSVLDLIIVPALAVDMSGHRIGYGKGFYDRFMKKLTHNPIKICIVPSDLVVQNSYCNEFDEKVNIIVCNNNVFKI